MATFSTQTHQDWRDKEAGWPGGLLRGEKSTLTWWWSINSKEHRCMTKLALRKDGQNMTVMARILGAFSNSNSPGAPSLWGFDWKQWGFSFKLLLQLVVLQTPAPERYTNQDFRNGFCTAFWRVIYDNRPRGHVVSVHEEGVFESWVCSFPLTHFTC